MTASWPNPAFDDDACNVGLYLCNATMSHSPDPMDVHDGKRSRSFRTSTGNLRDTRCCITTGRTHPYTSRTEENGRLSDAPTVTFWDKSESGSALSNSNALTVTVLLQTTMPGVVAPPAAHAGASSQEWNGTSQLCVKPLPDRVPSSSTKMSLYGAVGNTRTVVCTNCIDAQYDV
jgi:hypothetical protein